MLIFSRVHCVEREMKAAVIYNIIWTMDVMTNPRRRIITGRCGSPQLCWALLCLSAHCFDLLAKRRENAGFSFMRWTQSELIDVAPYLPTSLPHRLRKGILCGSSVCSLLHCVRVASKLLDAQASLLNTICYPHCRALSFHDFQTKTQFIPQQLVVIKLERNVCG